MNDDPRILELDDNELSNVHGGGIVEGDCIPWPKLPQEPEPPPIILA
jgi:hypothetical protein